MIKIGLYAAANGTITEKIERGGTFNGWVFKDENAFLHHPDDVCYIPELSDTTYTHNDILRMCNNQESLARECFYNIDWQHPETWIDEQFINEEWFECVCCGRWYSISYAEECPRCCVGD